MDPMHKTRINGLYAITPDTSDSTRLLQLARQALQGGIDVLQYRNKSTDLSLRLQQAKALQALCQQYRVPLIVNDDVDLALTINADGVHLGSSDGQIATARQRLGAYAIIGASCYNRLELADKAVADGADYVAFGSMFVSSTKPDAVKAPLSLLQQARNELDCPIVAIGGIGLENIAEVAAAGATAAAVITALFETASAELSARSLRQKFFF